MESTKNVSPLKMWKPYYKFVSRAKLNSNYILPVHMEAQEIQTLKLTYLRLISSNGEKWMPISLSAYSNWLKRPCQVKKFRLHVGDGYLLHLEIFYLFATLFLPIIFLIFCLPFLICQILLPITPTSHNSFIFQNAGKSQTNTIPIYSRNRQKLAKPICKVYFCGFFTFPLFNKSSFAQNSHKNAKNSISDVNWKRRQWLFNQ